MIEVFFISDYTLQKKSYSRTDFQHYGWSPRLTQGQRKNHHKLINLARRLVYNKVNSEDEEESFFDT